jgi:hypothetical protein
VNNIFDILCSENVEYKSEEKKTVHDYRNNDSTTDAPSSYNATIFGKSKDEKVPGVKDTHSK